MSPAILNDSHCILKMKTTKGAGVTDFFAGCEDTEDWREHWKGMPEFYQVETEIYAELTVKFDSEHAFKEFATLIGQKISSAAKGIWHPKKSANPELELRWYDES